MAYALGNIFTPNFKTYLHGRLKGPRNRSGHINQIAKAYGPVKTYVIHRSGNNDSVGMLLGSDCCANVHPMQEPSSHQVVQGIGIVGQDQFVHHGLGMARGLGWSHQGTRILERCR